MTRAEVQQRLLAIAELIRENGPHEWDAAHWEADLDALEEAERCVGMLSRILEDDE